ncbi:MAG: hybrid sensor histidine kinase/response regulator [Acidobacteria bacterium]|nr:hybrid sensor histidine kinase/response regulator [Acidobacteriota bacterium]
MSSSGNSWPTVLYVALVTAAGTAAGIALLRTAPGATPADLLALLAFGSLGLAWTLLTFTVARRHRGRVAVWMAPAAFQALLPIAPPWVVAAALLATLALDCAVHRRRQIQTLFNFGQSLACAWCAVQVTAAVRGSLPGLAGIGASALAGALTYSAVGSLLVQSIIYISSRRSLRDSGITGYSVVINEVVVSCFAALMALSWSVHPALLAVAVIPLTLLFLLLSRLERRERDLSQRQKELQTIQELGLQVSAHLEVGELGPVVVRIVAEDLHARGALLAFREPEGREFNVAALLDRSATPVELRANRLRRAAFDDAFLERGEPAIGAAADVAATPELAGFDATAFIAQPLTILGRPDGMILVFDGGQREPFTIQDAQRLAALARFVEVALDNARLYDDVKKMRDAVIQSEKLTALGQLVSGVAHELNNPLATIIGTAELCGGLEPGARTAGMLQRIQREAQRASRIVRSLLTFSRHHKPEIGWHDLSAIIGELVEMREYSCRVRNIALRTELDPHLPLVRVDEHQLHQVLLNLVTNAEQSIEETGRPGTVLVRTARDGRRVRIEVSDDGPGIPEEVLEKIFNPFFTTKPVGKGTGLGLSICYGIVQEHGGTIRVRSVPGGGATFAVELPVPDGAPRCAVAAEAAASPVSAPAPAAGRALVVDDEEGVRSVLAEALGAWGFSVATAATGHEALDLLAAERFRVAIVDLRMPGLDGPGVYERARELGIPLPPVVFSTGDAGGDEAREFLARAGAPVLMKPFTLLTLRETLDALLEPVPC